MVIPEWCGECLGGKYNGQEHNGTAEKEIRGTPMVKLGIMQMNAGGQELGSMGRGDWVTVTAGSG